MKKDTAPTEYAVINKATWFSGRPFLLCVGSYTYIKTQQKWKHHTVKAKKFFLKVLNTISLLHASIIHPSEIKDILVHNLRVRVNEYQRGYSRVWYTVIFLAFAHGYDSSVLYSTSYKIQCMLRMYKFIYQRLKEFGCTIYHKIWTFPSMYNEKY